jgi:hypothetical protein
MDVRKIGRRSSGTVLEVPTDFYRERQDVMAMRDILKTHRTWEDGVGLLLD